MQVDTQNSCENVEIGNSGSMGPPMYKQDAVKSGDEDSIPDIWIDCKRNSNNIRDREANKVWTKPMVPENLKGRGYVHLDVEHRGIKLDGEVYNVDPTLEHMPGELHKRLKTVQY